MKFQINFFGWNKCRRLCAYVMMLCRYNSYLVVDCSVRSEDIHAKTSDMSWQLYDRCWNNSVHILFLWKYFPLASVNCVLIRKFMAFASCDAERRHWTSSTECDRMKDDNIIESNALGIGWTNALWICVPLARMHNSCCCCGIARMVSQCRQVLPCKRKLKCVRSREANASATSFSFSAEALIQTPDTATAFSGEEKRAKCMNGNFCRLKFHFDFLESFGAKNTDADIFRVCALCIAHSPNQTETKK